MQKGPIYTLWSICWVLTRFINLGTWLRLGIQSGFASMSCVRAGVAGIVSLVRLLISCLWLPGEWKGSWRGGGAATVRGRNFWEILLIKMNYKTRFQKRKVDPTSCREEWLVGPGVGNGRHCWEPYLNTNISRVQAKDSLLEQTLVRLQEVSPHFSWSSALTNKHCNFQHKWLPPPPALRNLNKY